MSSLFSSFHGQLANYQASGNCVSNLLRTLFVDSPGIPCVVRFGGENSPAVDPLRLL